MNNQIEKLQKKYWWEKVQMLIFPPVCGICGKLDEKYLCERCDLELQKNAKFQINSYVAPNGFKRKYFDEHIYFFQYQGLIRNQIIKYKFSDEAYKYKAISNFILKKFVLKDLAIFQILNKYDVIIPVPISKKRFKERGYNQAELIAKEIAKTLEKRIITSCLYKQKNIIAQSKLNKEEREKNIKGVYDLRSKEKLSNKKVLIIDDIYTTGSTVSECSRVLKQANPSKIGVLTIAKD